MGIAAKIICDSIGPSGKRLTTFEIVYPRIILAELNTHRALSKNSASSRAIPIEKMIQRIVDDPFMPVYWGKNQKGMQAAEELSNEKRQCYDIDIHARESEREEAQRIWLEARDAAVEFSRKLSDLGLHKQIANRLTEPFQYMVTVITGTEWANFFHLRYHPAAQPEFQALAKAMYQAYMKHQPSVLRAGEWHLPYIRPVDYDDVYDMTVPGFMGRPRRDVIDAILCKVSTGRCARTSYLNQNGVRSLQDDIDLHNRLFQAPESGEPGHWSPFEHPARALPTPERSGNFIGWEQYRKLFPNENTTILPVLPL